MAILAQSATYTRMFMMIDSADHVTGKTGLTVTVTLSKAGGAFGAAGATITEVSSGWYKAALTTTDTNTLGDLAYHCTSTGADPTDFVDQVSLAGNNANLVMIDGLATSGNNATLYLKALDITNSGGTAVTFNATGSNGKGLAIAGNGSGQGVTIQAGATNANGLSVLGGGSGAGFACEGGATGIGFSCKGGATSGHGFVAEGVGNGIGFEAIATSNNSGFAAVGGGTEPGFHAIGGATGIGIYAEGGASSGSGFKALGAAGNADAMTLTPNGSGIALNAANVTAIKAKTDNLPENPQKNVGYSNFMFKMVDGTDFVTPKTGLTVVVKRSIDGGAFATATNSPATEVSDGWYKIDLSSADLNGDEIALNMSAATAANRDIKFKTAL